MIQFPGPVAAVVAGGGGHHHVFHVPSAGRVVVYNTALGRTVGTIKGADETAVIAAGREKLFTGHKDGSVVVWEVRGVKPVFSFQAHTADGGIWSLAMSADGKWSMTATVTGEVRFWDAEKVLKDAGGAK